VAATFGVGASAACVVDLGAESTAIACVEEGVVMPDGGSARLAASGDGVVRALVALMRAHAVWPEGLGALGAAAGVVGAGVGGVRSGYEWDLLRELRDELCYCVKVGGGGVGWGGLRGGFRRWGGLGRCWLAGWLVDWHLSIPSPGLPEA